MLDRPARNRLCALIERFLQGELTAFALDEEATQIAQRTEDQTVIEVVGLLWYHYDDLKDHAAALSHEEWDYIQRLLLLLRSESNLATRRHPWSLTQWVALAGLGVFVAVAAKMGIEWRLLEVTVPLGLLSMALAWHRGRNTSGHPSLFPFGSVSELLVVHRTVPTFRKRRYPEAMQFVRIRSAAAHGLMVVHAIALWLLLSPAVLLFQTFPRREFRVTPA